MMSTRPTRFTQRPSLSRANAGLERGTPQGQVVEQGRLPGGPSLFDAREFETPPSHRLTLAPRHTDVVVGTCSCGRIFEGHSSDAVSDAFNRSTCNR